jgi:hypothetical protein
LHGRLLCWKQALGDRATLRSFTAAESAAAHSHIGASVLMNRVVMDWMAETLNLSQATHRTLSTNSSHRVVPHTHDALVNDKTAAETSTQAIRDVVHAVPSDAPLEES